MSDSIDRAKETIESAGEEAEGGEHVLWLTTRATLRVLVASARGWRWRLLEIGDEAARRTSS